MSTASKDTAAATQAPRPRPRKRWKVLLGVAAVALALGTVSALPWEDNLTEYKVKGAFLYNFARYTEWPEGTFADDDAPLVFATLGEDPFGEILKTIVNGKALSGRPLQLRHHKSLEELLEAAPCHVLFVSESMKKQLPAVHKALLTKPIFTVSDLTDFATLGGTARFFIKQGTVRFVINQSSAKRQGLTISSQLLKLAELVKDAEGVGQ